MKKTKRILAVIMALSLLFTGFAPRVLAAKTTSGTGKGKYLQDIFVAYGKTDEEARKWLKDNGWEALPGDANVGLGKASAFDDEIAAVIGIRRTAKVEEAVKDLAVINMKGGYSYPDYEALVEQKKAEIDELVRCYIPVIEEFRANYQGKGGTLGKKRAALAFKVLNTLYDGDPKGDYAVNDTGMKLGDLFLSPLKQELGDAYDGLSAEEKLKHGDMQQIVLESSGPASSIIKQMLILGTDANKDTWLQRLSTLAGDGLAKNISKYVPEIKEQDLAPSAVTTLLQQKFGDTASVLASQWIDVNTEMQWYENYCEKYGLWQKDGEADKTYETRLKNYFTNLQKKDPARYEDEADRFYFAGTLDENLYDINYKGEWGQTLGDFFNPANGKKYGSNEELFLPFAAALSEGQRSATGFASLKNLLLTGFISEAAYDEMVPDLEKELGVDKAADLYDVYIGVNRGIFRSGVAMTSKALMEQNIGKSQAFNEAWNPLGIAAIASYSAAALGAVMLVSGAVMASKGTVSMVWHLSNDVHYRLLTGARTQAQAALEKFKEMPFAADPASVSRYKADIALADKADKMLKAGNKGDLVEKRVTGTGTAGRWLMGIGGALLVAAAVVEGVQLWLYYQKDMTPIPTMIVDEADIVTYSKDENGEEVKNIDFDSFVYYQAVKCNRPEVGEICDWNSGVAEYKDHNCYDIADLNCDYGQEWLSMYKNYSLEKGDPILADSVKLQYGSDEMPKGATNALHFFSYTYAADLGDTAYSYNNKQNGIYCFWQADKTAGTKARAAAAGTASAAGSTFSVGQFALGGAAGLILGIACMAMVMVFRKKKEEKAAAE